MQWKLVKAFDEGLKEYHLLNEEKLVFVLKYNSLQQSIRINGKGEYLTFFMERMGFANPRIVFKNVYGIEKGKCLFNRRHNKGHIDVDGREYEYVITGEALNKVVISLPGEKQPPLAVCEWPFHAGQFIWPFRHSFYEEYASLLLGLNCYIGIFQGNGLEKVKV